jgi:hypothetical protein
MGQFFITGLVDKIIAPSVGYAVEILHKHLEAIRSLYLVKDLQVALVLSSEFLELVSITRDVDSRESHEDGFEEAIHIFILVVTTNKNI